MNTPARNPACNPACKWSTNLKQHGMNQHPAPYTREEIASLLAFYADAGLDFPVIDETNDRFKPVDPLPAVIKNTPSAAAQMPSANAAPPVAVSTAQPVVTDAQAAAMAETVAAAAVDLDQLAVAVNQFTGCSLKRSARNTVFEGGNRNSKLMIIQAAPTREDDASGSAFQGPHGALLHAMLEAIGMERNTDLYAGYCVPWCPPGGQQPTARHMQICAPFLFRQIALAAPDRVIVMGNSPAQMLFNSRQTILRMRGQWQTLNIAGRNIAALPMLPTSILLDEPMLKRNTWIDLLSLKDHLAAAH